MDDSLFTEEIVEMIMQAKGRLPAGWKIRTYETGYYIILEIPKREFDTFSLTDRIRIAEVTNELCLRIKKTGIPVYIEKI